MNVIQWNRHSVILVHVEDAALADAMECAIVLSFCDPGGTLSYVRRIIDVTDGFVHDVHQIEYTF